MVRFHHPRLRSWLVVSFAFMLLVAVTIGKAGRAYADKLGAELFRAAESGNVDRARQLLGQGADPNASLPDSTTALHVAALKGNKAIVDLLLAHGAKVNVLMGGDITPLHVAVPSGNEDIVRALVEKGAKLDQREEDGLTPLWIAANKNQPGIAQYLISRGANLEIPDRKIRATPLHVASMRGFLPIVRSLVEAGAQLNPAAGGGFTPLALARRAGRTEVAEFLAGRGAK